MSDVNMKEVTYVNGTIAGGYSKNSAQTPSYYWLKRKLSRIIRMIGMYAMKMSKIIFDAQ